MASDFDGEACGISGWHAWHNHNLSVLIKSTMQVREAIDATGCISLEWDEGKPRTSFGANIIDMCSAFEIDNNLEIKNVYLTHLNVPSMSYMLRKRKCTYYDDVIMGAIASEITSLTIVYSTVYSGASPVNSPHKWPVKRKMFPFDDVIMVLVSNSKVCSMNRMAGTNMV